jgi:hypothetical protein
LKHILQSGRFGAKLESDITNDFNGNYKSLNGIHANKSDDNSMMEQILKNTDTKSLNGHYGSNTNLTAATSGGLPGLRGRTRQSVSGSE